MVNLIRRFQQPFLIALTILTILAFVVFFNGPGSPRVGDGSRTMAVATVYGRNISVLEAKRSASRMEICATLGMFDLYRALVGNTRNPNEQQNNFMYNELVLRHEAEQLGIMSETLTDSERQQLEPQIEARIKSLPALRDPQGGFSYQAYSNALTLLLNPRGFTQRDLEDIVADALRLDKVRAVVGSTVAITPQELLASYTQGYQKLQVSVVRLKLEDFKAAVQVTDDDVKKLYDERKETLKTPEKRKVKFAAFTPPKSAQPLEGEARGEQNRQLAEKAQALALAMTAPKASFDEEARKAGATTVGETPLFTVDQPPAELFASQPAAMAAARLTEKEPNSDPVGTPEGMLVLQLSGTEPARPLTLEEAKPQLQQQLKDERAQEAMGVKANELRTKIEADLKAGKSFADAATAAGVSAEKLAPFARAEPLDKDPDASSIMDRAGLLADGQLSEFVQTPTGELLIHLDQHLPVDQADFAKKKSQLAESLQSQKEYAVFTDWLRGRSKEANIQATTLGSGRP